MRNRASTEGATLGVVASGRGDDYANLSRVPLAPSFFSSRENPAVSTLLSTSTSTSTQVFHPVSAPGRGGALFRSDPITT